MQCGVGFLGMTIFLYHKRVILKNVKKFYRKFWEIFGEYGKGAVSYDVIYEFIEGWLAYARNADTYNLRLKIALLLEENYPQDISTKEINKGREALEPQVSQANLNG